MWRNKRTKRLPKDEIDPDYSEPPSESSSEDLNALLHATQVQKPTNVLSPKSYGKLPASASEASADEDEMTNDEMDLLERNNKKSGKTTRIRRVTKPNTPSSNKVVIKGTTDAYGDEPQYVKDSSEEEEEKKLIRKQLFAAPEGKEEEESDKISTAVSEEQPDHQQNIKREREERER